MRDPFPGGLVIAMLLHGRRIETLKWRGTAPACVVSLCRLQLFIQRACKRARRSTEKRGPAQLPSTSRREVLFSSAARLDTGANMIRAARPPDPGRPREKGEASAELGRFDVRKSSIASAKIRREFHPSSKDTGSCPCLRNGREQRQRAASFCFVVGGSSLPPPEGRAAEGSQRIGSAHERS